MIALAAAKIRVRGMRLRSCMTRVVQPTYLRTVDLIATRTLKYEYQLTSLKWLHWDETQDANGARAEAQLDSMVPKPATHTC